MNKLRTISWFLILVILLATLVSLTVAQEAPTAAGDRLLQDEPLSGEPLAQSAEETRIELSTAGRSALNLPAASVNLAPATADGTALEADGPIDTPVVEYPHDLRQPRSPKTASPVELEVCCRTLNHEPDFSGRFVGVPQPDPSLSAVAERLVNSCWATRHTTCRAAALSLPGKYLTRKSILRHGNFVSPPTSL